MDKEDFLQTGRPYGAPSTIEFADTLWSSTFSTQKPVAMRILIGSVIVLLIFLADPTSVPAQNRQPTPIRQSMHSSDAAVAQPLTLRDAARNNRWLGLGVRDVRWAADGRTVYFRWNQHPTSEDVPEEDPWFRTPADGSWVEAVPLADLEAIPGEQVVWSADGEKAAWTRAESVFLYEAGRPPRRVVSLTTPAQAVRFVAGDAAIDFESDEALYRYHLASGEAQVVAAKVEQTRDADTEAAEWLAEEQRALLQHLRRNDQRQARAEAAGRLNNPARSQALPVSVGEAIDQIQVSPDGGFVTFRVRKRAADRPPTHYVDYVDGTGYSQVYEARSKVGEPRDHVRLGVVAYDPTVSPDSVTVRWIELAEAGDQHTIPHGPYWNREGTRGVVQFIGEDHQDVWYAEIDLANASATVVTHDHDDAWIGGPPVQANYLQPALLEWLPGDRFVFASERSGWSHLYLVEPGGAITTLTEGPWEVRAAALSRDRTMWLIQASREHPADDHLYTMPAEGGAMSRLTDAPGRHVGYLSPDGRRLAVVFGDNVTLPDLYLGPLAPDAERVRVTTSGTDAYYQHPLVQPEIVSFTHPDGEPLWAALYRPATPNPERAAVLHIHGGGYRQFAHRGWSVYGYATHLGFLHYLLEQGYTVLDFDYRGSAGFGRDYRTDIARSMGIKDVDGAVAAAKYLVDQHGIDSTRIGLYGVSYGGFMTLMAQFRYPGVFAAGISRAPVTDWAHYSDRWTSRILGIPHEDPEAYRRSSPIYYAEGLNDALLITHGLVDDNVHFQDTARLIQRLIELEKTFEVMVYPVEPHTIQTEASRYDYARRAAAFFEEHLLRR